MAPDSTRSELQRQLNTYIGAGYRLIRHGQTAAGCDQWLLAWEVVKQLTTADIRSTEAFDRQHRRLSEYVSNWCQDFEMELGNAGRDAPLYYEARVRYVREFLALFPDESSLVYLNMRRAEGEALWDLDRRAEAEAVFSALVERLPDEAWGYIGWADRYWLMDDSPKEYDTAEAIMLRALERPNLQDRSDLLERLVDLYDAWGKPEERDAARVEMETLQQPTELRREPARLAIPEFPPEEPAVAPVKRKLGRNDPCWCGSGVKYKRCHLRADQQGG
jgi:tetratricopeptide (TPR) repeat protein